MNKYLLMLGGNFYEIRQILGLKQEELGNLMGVSRPTIAKLEQDPTKLTKTLAYAFFVAVSYEIQRRESILKEINPNDYQHSGKIGDFIEILRNSSLLSVGSLSSIAAINISSTIPTIGSWITAGIKNGFKSLKNKPVEAMNNWSKENAEKIINAVNQKLKEDNKKILYCFQLNSLDVKSFVDRIEDGGSDSPIEVW